MLRFYSKFCEKQLGDFLKSNWYDLLDFRKVIIRWKVVTVAIQ